MPKSKSGSSSKASVVRATPSAPSTSTSNGQYGGFSPVPLTLTIPDSNKSSKGKDAAAHYLWIREHKVRGAKTTDAGPTTSAVNPALVKPTLRDQAADADLELGAGRTLFIANLAVDMEEEDIRKVFKEYGPVERIVIKVSKVGKEGVDAWIDSDDEHEEEDEDDDEVDMEGMDGNGLVGSEGVEPTARPARPDNAGQKKRRRKGKSGPSAPMITDLPSLFPRSQPFLFPSSSAYVTYLSPLSLQRALQHAPSRAPIALVHPASSTGLDYYTQLHQTTRPDLSLVKAHADSALALYDHHVEVQKRKISQGPIVDDDGFTLVVRGGKFGRTAGKGSSGVGVASRRFVLDSRKAGGEVDAREGLDRGKKRKGGVELDGFYRFQRNEKKRQGM